MIWRIHILIVALFLSFAQMRGQETASATAAGELTLTGYVTIAKISDLMFGTIPAGTSLAVAASSANAAQFQISGSILTDVLIAVLYPVQLTSGSNALAFAPVIPIHNTLPQQSAAEPFASAAGGTISTGGDGDLYIWVGGRVSAAVNQPAGSYSGVVQITVTVQ